MKKLFVLASFLLIAITGCINITQPPASEPATPPASEPATLPIIESFSASPESVSAGSSTTLSWSVKNATSVMIAPDIGSVSATGSKEVKPSALVTYVLAASNSAGTSYGQVTIRVLSARIITGNLQLQLAALPTIESFSASPEIITVGGSSTLNWSVKNATSIMIIPEVGNVSATGSKTVKPATATMYTLIASNASGMLSQPVTVNVVSLQVIKPAFEAVKNPDLRIDDLTMEFGEVTYSFSNAGKANSAPCRNVLFIDGVEDRQDQILFILPPGAIVVRTVWRSEFTHTPELHTFEVRLDVNNTNDESDENNNSRSAVFNWK